jgi:phosphate-selective porin OprO/OprP
MHHQRTPTNHHSLIKSATALLTALCGILPQLRAGELTLAAPQEPAPSIFDKTWSLATLHKDESNPFIEEIALVGRYLGQFGYVSGDQREWNGWENREIRAGMRLRFLQQFEAEAQVNLNTDAPHLYDRITVATLTWKPLDEFNLAIGKQVIKFGYEGSTSTTQILTFERSNIMNNLWPSPEYITGAVASGKFKPGFFYQAGIFSGDQQAEFSQFNAGYGLLFTLGYDMSKAIGIDKAIVRADYFYNDGNPNNTAFKSFENIFTLSSQWQKGRLGLNTDVLGGTGLGAQSNIWGFLIEPYYNLTPQLQLVARYGFANSSADNGLALQKRYEQKVETGKGNEYQSAYFGVNYFIYGQKLKVMSGIEYSEMQDRANDGGAFNGWTLLTGVRMYF